MSRIWSIHTLRCTTFLILDGHCNDGDLMVVAALGQRLTDIHIKGSKRVTDAGIYALAAGCKHLEELHADGCSSITDAGIARLAVSCSSMRHFGLFGTAVTAEYATSLRGPSVQVHHHHDSLGRR